MSNIDEKSLDKLIDQYATDVAEYKRILSRSGAILSSSGETDKKEGDKSTPYTTAGNREEINAEIDQTGREKLVLGILFNRDFIEEKLKKNDKPDSGNMGRLLETDETLIKLYRDNKKQVITPENWRILYPEIPDENWWWYLDRRIYKDGERYRWRAPVNPLNAITSVMVLISGLVVIFFYIPLLGEDLRDIGLDLLFESTTVAALLGVVVRYGRGFREFLADHFDILKSSETEIPTEKRASSNYIAIIVVAVTFIAFTLYGVFVLPRNMFRSGNDALRRHDINNATYYYNLSISLQPRFSWLPIRQPDLAGRLNQLAEAYIELGDDDSAIELLEEAIASDSFIVPSMLRLADLYVDQSRYEDAIGLIDRSNGILNVFENEQNPGDPPPPDPDNNPPPEDNDGTSAPERMSPEDILFFRMEARLIQARVYLNTGNYVAARIIMDEAQTVLIDDGGTVFIRFGIPASGQRDPARIYYLRGYTYLHISETFNCTDETIRSARDSFTNLSGLLGQRQSSPDYFLNVRELDWLGESRAILSTLTDSSLDINCDSLQEGDIPWQTKDSY